MENWLLMQTFYHGLTTSTRENMNVAARGSFLSLTIHDAAALCGEDGSQPRMERRTHSTM
jgi:hypothetical protein